MLQAKWLKSKWLAIGWFVLMCVLFFLPGSAFPKVTWLSNLHIDKWVHTGLFAVLVFLWLSAFNINLPQKAWIVILLVITYGFLVEVIQKKWVSNRSFDMYDIVADTVGGIIGLAVWLAIYKKNKPL